MINLKDQIVIDDDYKQEPIEDLIRIQKSLFIYKDIYCTLDECGNIWQNYSWEHQASWLDIPKNMDDELKFIEKCYGFKSYKEWSLIDES